MTIGHCKHGEFELTEGCPQCIAERRERQVAEINSPDNIAKRIKEAVESVAGKEVPRIIVKVKYFSETTGATSDREYTYFSVDRLDLGEVVQVPVRDRVQKAVVTATDVPAAEIAAFAFQVKTIPSGSVFPMNQAPTLFNQGPPEPETNSLATAAKAAGAEVKEVSLFEEPEPPAIDPDNPPDHIRPPALAVIETHVGRPTTELFQLYQEAAGLLQFAKDRVIATDEDLKPATNDLVIIATCTKAMFARKGEIVGPLKAKLDLVNQAFNDIMFPVLEANRLTREKVTKFDQDQRTRAAEAKRIEDEKARLARDEAAFSGTGEFDVPLGTIEEVALPPERTRTDLGTLGVRDNWKARVVDMKLLPDEYKLPDMQTLNAKARSSKGTAEIPGVEFYNDRTTTIRPK